MAEQHERDARVFAARDARELAHSLDGGAKTTDAEPPKAGGVVILLLHPCRPVAAVIVCVDRVPRGDEGLGRYS